MQLSLRENSKSDPHPLSILNLVEMTLASQEWFGPFTSRNLTPEAPSGRPAGLTFTQFGQVMRHGIDFDHAHPQFGPLLQVMPWPAYVNMTEHDLRAIYEYLSGIPHAEPGSIGP